MEKNDQINVAAIRNFLNAIFTHLEEDLGAKEIEIDAAHNFFWEVPLDELFEVRATPPPLLMGSAIDSLEFVNTSIKAGAKDSYAATLMLMHVIPLLQVICHKIRA
jgi:hypothetical protein